MLFDDKLCIVFDENYCDLLNVFNCWIKENIEMFSIRNI